METAEAEGIARGCALATLRTFSYQAPEFYKKLGYEEYAVVVVWPRGHRNLAFRMRLITGVRSHESEQQTSSGQTSRRAAGPSE
jgi:hypothetical protein